MTGQLPPLLQEIADVVGIAAAIKLAEAKGGQRIFVPDTIEDGHWLAELIGLDLARQLSFYLTHDGGTHIDLPKGDRLRRAKRNDMIAEMLADGHSANYVASRFDLTRREIFRHKARQRERAESDQIDMFSPRPAK